MNVAIPAPCHKSEAAARTRQNSLTKPPGSLGRLEELAIQMAGFQASDRPAARPCSVLIFAADHPVARHGVSPYPSSVTGAMVGNFQGGGAAASVLSRSSGLTLNVIDAGVEGGPIDAEIKAGDIRHEDALSSAAFAHCIQRGVQSVLDHASNNRVTIFGEMGIGNTTAAAAVCAALLQATDPAELVGAGTGARGEILESKQAVVREAVARLEAGTSPLEILRRLGGREMAHLYGAIRQALSQRSLVLVDGFIVTAVAAILLREEPSARAGLVFAHRSDERAHARVLDALGVTPLLDLKMRLGEASGALLAYPLVERACLIHAQMATFESAGVAGETESS